MCVLFRMTGTGCFVLSFKDKRWVMNIRRSNGADFAPLAPVSWRLAQYHHHHRDHHNRYSYIPNDRSRLRCQNCYLHQHYHYHHNCCPSSHKNHCIVSFLAQNYHRPRLSEVISVITMITLITIINHHHEMSIKAPVSMRLALPQRPPVRQYTHVCHPTFCI